MWGRPPPGDPRYFLRPWGSGPRVVLSRLGLVRVGSLCLLRLGHTRYCGFYLPPFDSLTFEGASCCVVRPLKPPWPPASGRIRVPSRKRLPQPSRSLRKVTAPADILTASRLVRDPEPEPPCWAVPKLPTLGNCQLMKVRWYFKLLRVGATCYAAADTRCVRCVTVLGGNTRN